MCASHIRTYWRAPILRNFDDSSSSAVMVEEKGDSFAILSEVLDKASITGSVPDVDGMTMSGGHETPVRGEIAVLRLIILKFMNRPSRV